jgi:nucleoside-diphosphate-sugar epimerase
VPGQGPSQEDDPLDLNAPEPRGRTVAATQSLEQAVAEVNVGVILRYGILYGPGTWYSRDSFTSEQIQRGEIEATDAVTSFLHVADAAQAALQALDWPRDTLNIVDDAPASGKEWVPLYARLIGAPPPPVKSGTLGWERGASNARARHLGWRPLYPDWREGFKTVLG